MMNAIIYNLLFQLAIQKRKKQGIASLIHIPDSFKKIVVVKDYIQPWRDDNGIQYIGIEDFLLNEDIVFK